MKRIQLTLFIDKLHAVSIEKIRKEFNPVQYDLIKSHVTLCREDELEQIEKVILNLSHLKHGPVTIDFGKVVRFSEGKGVMIPATGDNDPFQQLREKVLQGIVEKPRKQEPHITLMHPRNATCTDDIFNQIQQCVFPGQITFKTIALIEQEAGKKWRVMKEFELNKEK